MMLANYMIKTFLLSLSLHPSLSLLLHFCISLHCTSHLRQLIFI